MTRFGFEAMGTMISGWIDCQGEAADEAIELFRERLRFLAGMLTPWERESALSQYNQGVLIEMPEELGEVIDLCYYSRRLTRGAFDPWGGPDGFDPSGLAKGWIVERAARTLGSVGKWWINAGGDVLVKGIKEPVAIAHPKFKDSAACVVAVSGAVATSGESERGAHIWRSPGFEGGVMQATVLGERLWLADVLATALFVAGIGLIEAVRELGYSAVCVTNDGRLLTSKGIERLA